MKGICTFSPISFPFHSPAGNSYFLCMHPAGSDKLAPLFDHLRGHGFCCISEAFQAEQADTDSAVSSADNTEPFRAMCSISS